MTTTHATRHQRREAKAARRRKRQTANTVKDNGPRRAEVEMRNDRRRRELARTERRRQEQLLALKGKGAGRIDDASKNAPKGFGKAKRKVAAEVVSIGKSLIKRVRSQEQEDQVAA